MTARVVLALTALTSCIDYDPDVGPLLVPPPDSQPSTSHIGCDNADSNPGVAVSFIANVRPLMTRSTGGCSPCHLGRVTSGLDLSSYESMRRGGLYSGTRVIVAGEPCTSVLWQKLSRTPPFGSRMPLNGPPYFSADELELVHDWIAEGAANN
jgi:hypothetical protein